MKNTSGLIVLAGLIAALAAPGAGFGEMRPQPLEVGLTQREVLSRWGAPDEREERETKREDVWRYKGGSQVSFAAGKVVTWEIGRGISGGIPLSPALAESAARSAADADEVKVTDSDVKDILDQIVEKSNQQGSQPQGNQAPSRSAGALDMVP